MGAIQTIALKQYRYYGNNNEKNYLPSNFENNTFTFFSTEEGKGIYQYCIYMYLKSRPGLELSITLFKPNAADLDNPITNTYSVILDHTGIYELDLRDSSLNECYIKSIAFTNLDKYSELQGNNTNTVQTLIQFSKPFFSILLGKDVNHSDATK